VKPTTAFDQFQTLVNADPSHVKDARTRRDVFCGAFRTLPDCTEQLPSGSLARGTQRDPIHDVDLIMVFDAEQHLDWDTGAGSAEVALEYVRGQVTDLLGVTRGSHARKVRHTLLRNHVVKCFLDDPDDPDAFAVEVMPALRVAGGLRVPERKHNRWATVNPEYLMAAVAVRHAEWNKFAPMVRVIKAWKDHFGLDMKSLVAEILVLERLPSPGAFEELTRQVALQRFFTAAAAAVMNGVHDPAGLCGEIQPNLDRAAVRARLLESADLAARAVAAEGRGDHVHALRLWRAVFGPDFPLPTTGTGVGAVAGTPALLGSARPRVKEAPQG
jgi:hypothetical protein